MRRFLTLPKRVVALTVYVFLLILVCRLVTGVWMPPPGGKNLWFVSSIGLWFFTQLSTPFFVKPRDAVARSALTGLTLSVVDLPPSLQASAELNVFRWIAIAVASLTSLVGILAIFLHRNRSNAGKWHAYFSRVTYRFAERFGRGQVIFTPAVLISIFGFYQGAPLQQLWLLFFWTVLVFLQPVELIFHLVADFRVVKAATIEKTLLGEITRIDHPGIVRVKLKSAENWLRENGVAVCLADSKQVEVLPLFIQTQGSELIGTGICHKELRERIPGLNLGEVFCTPECAKQNRHN